jgi:3-hydroxyisobutyrate dehydrogenase-like beta-hydroxyacid dehydrogenase
VPAATEERLRFFVGGAADHVARVEPLLAALGSIDHVGEWVGAGHAAKLLANLLWFGQVAAVAEVLLLGQSLGIEPVRLRDSLATSAGGSRFIDDYVDSLLEGDYLEHFGLDRVVEELEILEALAVDADVPFELSATVTRLHREALARFGAVDGELLVAKLLEERAGRTLRH